MKIVYTNLEDCSNATKLGKHPMKKSFINNAVETLISFRKNHQDQLRLHVSLGGSSNVGKKFCCLEKKEFFFEAEK